MEDIILIFNIIDFLIIIYIGKIITLFTQQIFSDIKTSKVS